MKRIIQKRISSHEQKFSQYLSMVFKWSFKAVDHVKRKGQVTTYLKIVCAVFSVFEFFGLSNLSTSVDKITDFHLHFQLKSKWEGRNNEF